MNIVKMGQLTVLIFDIVCSTDLWLKTAIFICVDVCIWY